MNAIVVEIKTPRLLSIMLSYVSNIDIDVFIVVDPNIVSFCSLDDKLPVFMKKRIISSDYASCLFELRLELEAYEYIAYIYDHYDDLIRDTIIHSLIGNEKQIKDCLSRFGDSDVDIVINSKFCSRPKGKQKTFCPSYSMFWLRWKYWKNIVMRKPFSISFWGEFSNRASLVDISLSLETDFLGIYERKDDHDDVTIKSTNTKDLIVS